MKFDIKVKQFFDRALIVDSMDRATRKGLSLAGKFIRDAARGLIRPGKNRDDKSTPGEPPKSHKGLLKKHIYYWGEFTKEIQHVLVGPAPLRGGNRGEAPQTLEFGGTTRAAKNPRRRTRKVGGVGEIRLDASRGSVKKGASGIVYAQLKTEAQVRRAKELNEALYGPWMIRSGYSEPRPYMRPAMEKGFAAFQRKMPEIYSNVFGPNMQVSIGPE